MDVPSWGISKCTRDNVCNAVREYNHRLNPTNRAALDCLRIRPRTGDMNKVISALVGVEMEAAFSVVRLRSQVCQAELALATTCPTKELL